MFKISLFEIPKVSEQLYLLNVLISTPICSSWTCLTSVKLYIFSNTITSSKLKEDIRTYVFGLLQSLKWHLRERTSTNIQVCIYRIWGGTKTLFSHLVRVNHFLLNLKIKTFLDILHTGVTVNFKTFFLLSHHPFYFLVRQQKIRFRLRKKVFVMLQCSSCLDLPQINVRFRGLEIAGINLTKFVRRKITTPN